MGIKLKDLTVPETAKTVRACRICKLSWLNLREMKEKSIWMGGEYPTLLRHWKLDHPVEYKKLRRSLSRNATPKVKRSRKGR